MILSYLLIGIITFFLVLVLVRLFREFAPGDWLFQFQRQRFMQKRKSFE